MADLQCALLSMLIDLGQTWYELGRDGHEEIMKMVGRLEGEVEKALPFVPR